jgi:hypothetical protein
MTEELDKLLGQDEEQTQAYFSRMKSEATNGMCFEVQLIEEFEWFEISLFGGFEMVSKERSVWMEETTEVMRRQMRVLDNIDIRVLRHAGILRLRATVLKTFQDIINVEGEFSQKTDFFLNFPFSPEEVKNLQKVLYHCELGKAELEEDFVGLVSRDSSSSSSSILSTEGHCKLTGRLVHVFQVKTYQELNGTIEEGKPLSKKDTKLQSRDVTDPPLP